MLNINNRRYIGSKTNLLNNIDGVIKEYYGDERITIADIFGGTGVVANYFYQKGYNVIVNDILFSNFVAYQTWMGKGEYDKDKVRNILNDFNKIDGSSIGDNYFSLTFGNKYYHVNDAKKIGFIRESIEEIKSQLTEREYYILITSLMYECDKIANTCGHFESFLKYSPKEKGVMLREPEINMSSATSQIFCEDSNELVKKISSDVCYVDPPYNARQYVNFYHVLENLVRWEKPIELEGVSNKFKRDHLKSEYSRAKAPEVFADLIANTDAKLIIVSYNNTYNAKSGASNNKITESQLVDTLKNKGSVSKKEIKYKSFNTGKTNFNDHKEILYICEVRK